MSEIRHVAPLHESLASRIAQRPSRSHPIEPSCDAHAWPDTVVMDWLRLRTMVDALLRRAADAKDAADAFVATRTACQRREAIHG